MVTQKDMEEEIAQGFEPDERITNADMRQARAQEFMVLFLERIDKKLGTLLTFMEKRKGD